MGSNTVAGNHIVIVTSIFHQKTKKKTPSLVDLLHLFSLESTIHQGRSKRGNKSNMNNERLVKSVSSTVGNSTGSKARYENR